MQGRREDHERHDRRDDVGACGLFGVDGGCVDRGFSIRGRKEKAQVERTASDPRTHFGTGRHGNRKLGISPSPPLRRQNLGEQIRTDRLVGNDVDSASGGYRCFGRGKVSFFDCGQHVTSARESMADKTNMGFVLPRGLRLLILPCSTDRKHR